MNIDWLDNVIKEILKRKMNVYTLATGKSPSGPIHIGILRELIIADVIKRQLEALDKNVRIIFIIDDYDPVRNFPSSVSLSLDEWAGVPYCDVPDEFGCCKSYGAHYARELIEVLPDFGIEPEIVWTSELYECGKMLDAIRVCLRQANVIRDIMIENIASNLSEEQRSNYIESMRNWYPASVVCPECGHLQSGTKDSISPNRVLDYNAIEDSVYFRCHNCGFSSTMPLSEARIKLTWRVEWPVKWYLFDVVAEPAGKDHSVRGGSYDTGLKIIKSVFKVDGPIKIPYEWVQIEGRDMSTSEGITLTPSTWLSFAPPSVYRYLILKTDLKRTINIDPHRIPELTNSYDRLEQEYYRGTNVDSLYPLCECGRINDEYIPKLPFGYAVVAAQLQDLLGRDVIIEESLKMLMNQFGDNIPQESTLDMIEQRLDLAENWVKSYGSSKDIVDTSEVSLAKLSWTLTDRDRQFLVDVMEELRKTNDLERVQSRLFDLIVEYRLDRRGAFALLYKISLGRSSGPRFASLVQLLGREYIIDRIEYVLNKDVSTII